MSASAVTAPVEAPEHKQVAPPWHTLSLVCLFLVLVLGALLSRHDSVPKPEGVQNADVFRAYFSIIAMEWGLILYLWIGMRKRGTKLLELVGGRWRSWRDFALDTGIAFTLLIAWLAVEKLWSQLSASSKRGAVDSMLPHSGWEILLWVAVSVSAGICEELLFRGYFQRQLQVLMNSKVAAVFFQAALFAALHAPQGLTASLKIGVLGILYGIVALRCGTLRPGIIAHSATDILSGFLSI